jgi:amidase
VHPDCVAAAEDAAKLCESLGHHVEDARPEIDAEVLVPAFLLVVAAETEAELMASVKRVGRPPKADDFEVPTRLLGLIGRQYSAPRLATAVRELHRIARGVGRFFQTYDVMLTPTLGSPPVTIGALQPTGIEAAMQKLIVTLNAGIFIHILGGIEKLSQRVFDFVPFTPLFNVTGQPAMSVPLYWNAEGLPIGVQFAARFGDEATLFRLAAQLEATRPWIIRRPPIS